MQIYLLKDVAGLGYKGQVVNVAAGYFSNFLFPNRFALAANSDLRAKSVRREEQRTKHRQEITAKAAELQRELEDKTLVFHKKASVKGKLYASLTEKNIHEGLIEQFKLDVDTKQIVMSEHIKSVGEHAVSLELAEGVNVQVKVEVKAV